MTHLEVVRYEFEQDECYVTCPSCKACEGHPVDEQVSHRQQFELVSSDCGGGVEEASGDTLKCSCGCTFWAYAPVEITQEDIEHLIIIKDILEPTSDLAQTMNKLIKLLK